MELYELTIAEASERLARRDISAVELTRAHLDRIAAVERYVRAFVTVTPEVALAAAAAADRRLAAGERGPLLGVPMALKDVISTRGIRTTCSSKMLEHFVPIYDATVVTRLNAAGAVLLGKTNMDEFAMGSSCENSAFFPTHNPWDLERVPGGSSGGSAAAVAAGEAIYSLGSDTGGSIRQPAALCGVVGLKPTYGRVSRFGLVAFASSLDQIGPLARTVEDAAIVLTAIAGRDPNDSTSADVPVPDFRAALHGDLRGLRLGVPKEYFVTGMQPGVDAALRAAIRELEALGATVDWDVSLPHTEYALAVYYLVAPSEASANLARYDGVKYGFSAEAPTMWEEMERTRGLGFGPEVKRRIMLGTYALSAGYYDAYYLKAQKVRTLIKRDFDEAFARYDALLAPTSPTVAFRLGEKLDDPLQMYLSDVCTLPINIAGVCALSVPAGLSEGLPVGLQIIGKPFDEATILRIGHAYQQVTRWHLLRPALAAA
ncbi:MAG: Asp-tRNA(Asn)/Glu-tRNA(Gln) amidotransferase subunit GatA [Chloroflexota bacterium]|nr:Asp-tRNA(Asn)/Glu-tRNA(Gln) amidotransferase subunit GatA [Dehalococcoidia bacterium]MDW8254906.1 Asp-tRNA(Asn)/Glu-tRNA(Gln) amidotransferase subunit GatA [Chloroflexota bacterium]